MDPKKLSILAIQNIRRSLERKSNDPRVFNMEFIHYIKYILFCHGNEALQTEAAWIFTNIAAGSTEQTKIIVDSGVIPLLVNLVSSTNLELVEQCIWALGNIMGDDVEYRDMILDKGIMEPLLSLVSEDMTNNFLRTVAWVFVNIVRCREKPLSLEMVKGMLPKLCLLAARRDISIRVDALWALTFIADYGEAHIELIIETDVVHCVMPYLSHHNQKLQLTTMRFLGNIATGSDHQTQVLLDHGLLNNLRFALIHHHRGLRRTALWCLSNITVGTQSQCQEVFYSGLLSVIVDSLNHIDPKITKEALFTVRNMITGGSIEQMLDIIDCRAINPMFSLVMSDEPEIAEAARVALNTLFAKGGLLVEKYARLYDRMMNGDSSP